jgi:SAM-dependent methyltransferase
MSINSKLWMASNDISIQHRNSCSICGGAISPVIKLPKLPLTDSYCRHPVDNPLPGIDQRLLYCESCGHGQLETLIAPAVLYGSNYCFRTSSSATARKGTEFFLSVIKEAAPDRKFRCVLDLGCNDLFLLNLLKDKAEHRVGIDPVWEGREDEREDKSIQVFGKNFEDVNLTNLPAKPDLIVCRHTLEHIVDPLRVVQALMNIAADDALFVFEVPGFDGLIERFRFDQVFHQHAQYFTLASFLKLLEIVSGRHLLHRFNFHDWSAMAVAFVKGTVSSPTDVKLWAASEISKRYALFQKQIHAAGDVLNSYATSPLYGYGAAQMLPVLGYHMKTDFGNLIAILDDDESKDGIGYWNLPVKVLSCSKVENLREATVVITALDNVQPIMQKLLAIRPRHIIFPLNTI